MLVSRLFFAFVLISGSVTANERCFTNHIDEAIDINYERLPLYQSNGGQRAKLVSEKLIKLEKELKLISWYYDLKDKKFQNNGRSVLCDNIVSMDLTPSYEDYTERPAASFNVSENEIELYVASIKDSLKKSDYQKIEIESVRWIRELGSDSLCLVKHFIESIALAAKNAQGHILKYQNKGNVKKLVNSFIKLHLFGMKRAFKIDELAFPLQQKRIPILCNDVPPIYHLD